MRNAGTYVSRVVPSSKMDTFSTLASVKLHHSQPSELATGPNGPHQTRSRATLWRRLVGRRRVEGAKGEDDSGLCQAVR